MAILKLKNKIEFHIYAVSMQIQTSLELLNGVLVIVVNTGRAFHPGISDSVPFLTSLRGTTQHAVPCQQIKSVTGAVAQRNFFFPVIAIQPSTLVLIELMRTNHSVKRGISTPISNKCDASGVWGHAAGADAAKSFTGFQARCKIDLSSRKELLPRELASVTRQEPIRP